MGRHADPTTYQPFQNDHQKIAFLGEFARELIPATPKQIIGQVRPLEFLFVRGTDDGIHEIEVGHPKFPPAASVKAYYALTWLQRRRLLTRVEFTVTPEQMDQ